MVTQACEEVSKDRLKKYCRCYRQYWGSGRL